MSSRGSTPLVSGISLGDLGKEMVIHSYLRNSNQPSHERAPLRPLLSADQRARAPTYGAATADELGLAMWRYQFHSVASHLIILSHVTKHRDPNSGALYYGHDTVGRTGPDHYRGREVTT